MAWFSKGKTVSEFGMDMAISCADYIKSDVTFSDVHEYYELSMCVICAYFAAIRVSRLPPKDKLALGQVFPTRLMELINGQFFDEEFKTRFAKYMEAFDDHQDQVLKGNGQAIAECFLSFSQFREEDGVLVFVGDNPIRNTVAGGVAQLHFCSALDLARELISKTKLAG